MRTKAIILGAALLAAGAATSMAQSNVYSLNVVGYINLNLTNGLNLVANNLDFDGTGTNNSMTNVLAGVGVNGIGTTVYKFDTGVGTFDIWQYSHGGWATIQGSISPAAASLNPGEAAFVSINTSTNITVVGTVLQGNSTNSYLNPAGGFSMVSPVFPLANTLDSTGNGGLGWTDVGGTFVFVWDVPLQTYDTWQYSHGGWSSNAVNEASGPLINIGTGFFLNTSQTTWTNSFTVQ